MVGSLDTWDLDAVCIWLNCIGLGEKVEPFRENTVDGDSLLALTQEDLTTELGLSNLQAKKVLRNLEETKEIAALKDGGGAAGGGSEEAQQLADKLEAKEAKLAELAEKLAALEKENGELKEEVERLKAAASGVADVAAKAAEGGPVQVAPAGYYAPPQPGYGYPPPPQQPGYGYPPPQQQYPPPQQQQYPPPEPERRNSGPGVVGGAAMGAAGGAMKGAVIGAILPGMDAGDGAAAGAAAGALGGAGRGFLNRRRH